jgi:exopolyphosphatase / guanosine-5'-triphosphate,3'-diphosphate pyrophosphatase
VADILREEAAVLAALDLGTNNCRLLIARPARAGGFRVVDGFSRIVRLGEGLESDGVLGEAAMGRALGALSICAAKMRKRGVTAFRGVATEACRRARNGAEFLARVHDRTGLDLEAIAPSEEADLALAGCAALLDQGRPHGIAFDIGGGSTEVLWLARENDIWRRVDFVSLPMGVVAVAARLGQGRVAEGDYTAAVADIAGRLGDLDARHGIAGHVAAGRVEMVGTSGTVTTLSGMAMGLERYDRAAVDGSWLDLDTVRRLSADLAAADFDGRARHGCVGRERADLVVAGCALLEGICARWPVPRLRVADRGLREGILMGLMRRA